MGHPWRKSRTPVRARAGRSFLTANTPVLYRQQRRMHGGQGWIEGAQTRNGWPNFLVQYSNPSPWFSMHLYLSALSCLNVIGFELWIIVRSLCTVFLSCQSTSTNHMFRPRETRQPLKRQKCKAYTWFTPKAPSISSNISAKA